MVFARKIKSIEKQPCLIIKMDIDMDRKRISLLDISNTVYIFNIQSLNNVIEEWRLKFQSEFNYADIRSLDKPLFKFSSFQAYKPTSIKFSSSKCKLDLCISKTQGKKFFEKDQFMNTTKIEDQVKNAEIQNKICQSQAGSMMESTQISQKPQITRTYTTHSEKSNKKIKINMIYSADQSVIIKDSEISSHNSQKEQIQNIQNNFEDLYAIAIQELQGNIKIFSPLIEVTDWIKIGDIVYQDNKYSTLDFSWSKQSKFLFVVYSDMKLIQYDPAHKFTPVKKYAVDFSHNYKIISNPSNNCLILKNDNDQCQAIDFDIKKSYTFEVFKKAQPVKNNNVGEQISNNQTKTPQNSNLRKLNAQYPQKENRLSQIIQKQQGDKQNGNVRLSNEQIIVSNTRKGINQKGNLQFNYNIQSLFTHSFYYFQLYDNFLNIYDEQDNLNTQDYDDDDGEDEEEEEQEEEEEYDSESFNTFDELIVDKSIKENIADYMYEPQISVSPDAKYICIGSIQEKGVLLYSVITNKDKEDSYEWNDGFKKAYFESQQIQVEGSSFSDYQYIQQNIHVSNFPTKSSQIVELLNNLDLALSNSQTEELPLQRILAVGSQQSLVFYSIIEKEKKPFFKKLITVQDLKSDVKHIVWINAYSLLLLLSDYSLVYLKTSPADLGFSVQVQASYQLN